MDYYGCVILKELNRQPPDLDAIRRSAPDIKLLLKLRDAIEFDHKLVHELKLAESVSIGGRRTTEQARNRASRLAITRRSYQTGRRDH
jgi:hypothetical protein